ncbi:glycosyltransferase family 4 protein [Paenibacillus humicola]|uniref:glycosyltransferase family 4 protein n=1 Tax=Paenibacillus humicola TaxID=3110540 RepID=UPI00237A5500|nr:glycosyltransferase family 1 protein [Paenibacillus humicola]
MKRIGLLLSSDPNFGGTFQYSLNMLDAIASLPAARYTPVIAYVDPVWRKYLEPYSGMEIIDLSWWQEPFPSCDLWVFPAQEGWDFQKKVPVLTAVHDLMHRYESEFPEVSEGEQYDLREEIYRNICKWSAGILVDSATGRKHVHESYGYPLENIYVLPYIPPQYIHHPSPGDFDRKFRLPKRFIFYPGHFWKHKNHLRLIEAVALLSRDLPDIHLVFAGLEKNGLEELWQSVEQFRLENRVHFLGYVPDRYMPELYKRARALVMPTFFGPTNIPPLEAFVLGCPVAVSKIYGMPEQTGDAALLFDPNSVTEIAKCVRRLWTDDGLCKDLIRKGKQRAADWGKKQFNQRLQDIIAQLTS